MDRSDISHVERSHHPLRFAVCKVSARHLMPTVWVVEIRAYHADWNVALCDSPFEDGDVFFRWFPIESVIDDFVQIGVVCRGSEESRWRLSEGNST